jgi:hypothetical protein
MKSLALIFLLALVVAAPSLTEAQIPNPGFETWAAGQPTGWITDNTPGFDTTVTQTSTSHSGSWALKGKVASFMGLVSFPPWIWAEFPIAQRYSTFSGWYTFTPVGGDSLYGWLVMYKGGSGIGVSVFSNKTTRGSFTQFNATINYFAGGVPDSCWMWFAIIGSSANGDTIHAGSTFTLDDLTLSGTATGVEQQSTEPVSYSLSQNFPNPFNPSTMIAYQTAKSGPVRLAVYDILGREVATLVNSVQPQGSHEVRFDAGELSSGVYIYRLQTP